MNNPPAFEPSPDFSDPRLQDGFQPGCWPLCDGQSAPAPNPAGLHERRCLEFLALFYRLNVLNARLHAARAGGCPDEVARPLLSDIAAATADLERLEDRYAPIGFFGEPIMDGIRYRSIDFVRPEQPRIYPTASELFAHFAIPGIEAIPASELCGSPRIIHFRHAKVDF
jgi:hypothetical protein